MQILGSCLAINLRYSGCCVWSLSPPCSNNGCYCDQSCFKHNDCCNDITVIGCHPAYPSSPIASPIPTHTLGKKKSETLATIKFGVFLYHMCMLVHFHQLNDKIILNLNLH